MKRYVKLSLLLLLIPLFAKNVYAEELINDKSINQIEIIEKIEDNEEILEEYEIDEDIEEIEEYEIEEESKNKDNTNINSNEEIENEIIEEKVSNDDIKTGTSEDTNTSIVTIEEIIESIDTSYELDLEETDNLNNKVKDLLKELIDNKLNKNNYNLESLGYSYELVWNYLENDKVDSYTLILKNSNNELSRKELTIKYNKSLNKNDEDNKKIEEFLKNNDLSLNKEYTLEEVLSNKTIDLNTYLTNKLKDTGIDFFILNKNNINDLYLSNSSTYKVILSINGIIYKKVNVDDTFITVIDYPKEEDKVSYIENILKEKLLEYNYITIENVEYILEDNKIYIITENSKILLGNIKINEIINNYKITTGANSTITNNDSLKLGLESDIKDFKRIEVNSVELNPNYYTINNSGITIYNEFIKSLNKGNYNLEVIYKTGRVKTTFNITWESSTAKPSVQNPVVRPNYPYRPNYTGNTSSNKNDYVNNDAGKEDEEDEATIEKKDEEKDDEEKNDEKDKENDKDEIDLGAILEDNKDNDKPANSKDMIKEKDNKKEITSLLKSRYVPIIIVIIAILVGGVTAFVYLKAKEEHIL